MDSIGLFYVENLRFDRRSDAVYGHRKGYHINKQFFTVYSPDQRMVEHYYPTYLSKTGVPMARRVGVADD